MEPKPNVLFCSITSNKSDEYVKRQTERFYRDANIAFKGPQYMAHPVIAAKDTFLLWDITNCEPCKPGPICFCDALYFYFERMMTTKKLRMVIANPMLYESFQIASTAIAQFELQIKFLEDLRLEQKKLSMNEKKDKVFMILVQKLLQRGLKFSTTTGNPFLKK